MEHVAIELKEVFYAIKEGINNQVLLNNSNHCFTAGAITTISGPSGSGKTTLLYALAGLLNIVSGEILYEGLNINALLPKERDSFRLNNIGIVFQNLNLFPFMNVLDNVLVPLHLKRIRITRKIEQQIDEYLLLMNLGDIKDKSIQVLSGGE